MTILCGTDLSAASLGALDVALALARLRGDRDVVLVHATDEDAREPALDQARSALLAQAKARPTDDVVVRTELVTGAPEVELVAVADREHADLIVVAARSQAPSLAQLGTKATAIIARSHVPVIAVRDPEPWLAFAAGRRPLRVMIGIDDSAVCELGMQWTHRLRGRGQVETVLGAVYYPDEMAEHYGLPSHGMIDRDPEIERLMERDLRRRFGGDLQHVVARPRRGLGRIGDHMVELAREEKVDVIVVGTGQKTGIGRLGSVSTIIVHDAPQSVVCVPPNAQVPTIVVPVLRAALVATDLSQFSNRAIPYAFAACEPDAEIHLLHVVDEDEEVDLDAVTRALRALAPSGASQKVSAHVARGDDAALAVAQTAARLGVDLICICSHGRSGLTRALVGSVADRLLRATRLPMLVLRPA